MLKPMPLLAILAVLLGGGAWNYQRNAHMAEEAKVPRPYKSLSMEQLDSLLDAYTQEKTKLQKSLAKLEGQGDASGSYAPSDLKGKVGGFERAQKQAGRYNDVHSAMLDREVEIDRIQAERSRRASGNDSDSAWALALRRIVTF
jgi:hypothetical protein